jgi:hypothetical protein
VIAAVQFVVELEIINVLLVLMDSIYQIIVFALHHAHRELLLMIAIMFVMFVHQLALNVPPKQTIVLLVLQDNSYIKIPVLLTVQMDTIKILQMEHAELVSHNALHVLDEQIQIVQPVLMDTT